LGRPNLKYFIIPLLVLVLPLSLAQVDCGDADLSIPVDLRVSGQGCGGGSPQQDSETINITTAGKHEVKGIVERGNGHCQPVEEFFLEINGGFGPVSPDDPDPCASSITLDDLGEFNFTLGDNLIIMHTAALCPPNETANSVMVERLCIFFEELANETSCGDGVVQNPNDNNESEECDDNGLNGIPCVPGYASSCIYCGSSCINVTLNGSFCGDGIKDEGFEECDGQDGVPQNFTCAQNCTLIPISTCEEMIMYSEPFHENNARWINSVSKINFTSDCTNATVFYKDNWFQNDSFFCEGNCNQWNASNVNDTDWIEFLNPFMGVNESCHVFEYHTISNNLTSLVSWDCIFADKSPPILNKTIGDPKNPMSQENIMFGEAFFPGMNETCEKGDCWEILTTTPITLSCHDPEPHPSGQDKLCFQVMLDGVDNTNTHCDNNTFNTSGDGFCCFNSDHELFFNEESWHKLSVYCKDKVNKTSEIHMEFFKVEGVPFNIYLYQKWNLISVPFVLVNDSPDELFKNLEHINSVWAYDGFGGQWLVWSPEGPNSLLHILPGWGYWVLMAKDENLSITGDLLQPQVLPPDRPLTSGWNLIGFYGTAWQEFNGMDDKSFMCGDEGDEAKVDVFGNPTYCALNSLVDTQIGFPRWSSLWSYVNCGNHVANWTGLNICDDDKMYAGRGYWLEIDVEDLYAPATVCAASSVIKCID